MVDPFLTGTKVNVLPGLDFPVIIDFPVTPTEVPHLDAVLITHSDTDHLDMATCEALSPVTTKYYSTLYVDSLLKEQRLPASGYQIGDTFHIGPVHIKLTPADHLWQNSMPGISSYSFRKEDACGFWIETEDGTIWVTGDSQLMDEHLNLPAPDVILLDISDSEWHFQYSGIAKIAETYPGTTLIFCHWGSVDAPAFPPFNANPDDLKELIINPVRIRVLAPGEPFILKSGE